MDENLIIKAEVAYLRSEVQRLRGLLAYGTDTCEYRRIRNLLDLERQRVNEYKTIIAEISAAKLSEKTNHE